MNVCTREILIDSAYENYYFKVFLEKYNFNDYIEIYSGDSYNLDSNEEYPDDFDVKIPMKKIQIKKIKCIHLFLEKTCDLISIHPEMSEMCGKSF